MTIPTIGREQAPTLDGAAMRSIDAAASADYAIDTTQLMEIAGFQVARAAAELLSGASGKRIVVAAGGGNNGGDALVAARYLVQRGAAVQLWMRASQRLSPLTARHRRTLQQLGIPVHEAGTDPFPGADMVIDGLLGTGIQLPVRPDVGELLQTINAAGPPALAVDLPSGLDADTGAGVDGCIRARWTVTLGLPKPALLSSPATGRLFVADIGLPPPVFGPLAGAVRQLYALGDLVEVVGLAE